MHTHRDDLAVDKSLVTCRFWWAPPFPFAPFILSLNKKMHTVHRLNYMNALE